MSVSFREKVCAHLSAYKKNVLGIPEAGIFLYRGRKVPKDHILPLQHLQRNILEPYTAQFFLSEHKPPKLHKYFHHLNSSQALCINLFFPLMADKQYSQLACTLSTTVPSAVHPRFESESTLEVAKRKTSFDLHLASEQEDVFVEVKYTEDGFGGAKKDEEHRQKFRDTYLPLLKRSPFLQRHCHDADVFLENYQILRNLVHITERSKVVFLFPRANEVVADQALKAQAFLTDLGRERLRILFLEDLVPELAEQFQGSKLNQYYRGVAEKYLG